MRNIIWKALERGSSVIVTLLVNIVLARLLEPSVHGLLAIVSVFVTVSEHFLTDGINVALIQSDKADTVDFSSALYINSVISLFLYAVFFLSAPYIAAYFGYPELAAILRVLSLRLIVWAVNSIQCAYISRNMLFRHYFYSTLSGKVLSGVIGIAMAYLGCGVWALVAQSVSIVAIETAVLWFRVKWRPTLEFSWERGKKLFSFGCKVMFAKIIEVLTDSLRSIIIGKRYTSEDLAFYNKGSLFPNSITSNVSYAVSAVMLPVLSDRQDDRDSVRDGCRLWMRLFGYCMLPVLTGFAATASVLVPLLLTAKWIPSVPYLRIFCGIYASWVVEVPVRESIKAMGRADVCLRMQIIKAVCSLAALLVSMRFGVYAIALSALLCAGVNVAVSVVYGVKYLGYSVKMFAEDVIPSLLLCALMALPVLLLPSLIHGNLLCLAAQTVSGMGVYVLASMATKNRSFKYITGLLRGRGA